MTLRKRQPPARPAPEHMSCAFCGKEKKYPPGFDGTAVCDNCQDRLGIDECSFCREPIDEDADGGLCDEHRHRCEYTDECDVVVHPDPASPVDAMCSEHADEWEQKQKTAEESGD